MNYSMVAGSTASFQAQLTPTNGAQAPGTTPKWVASDPAVVLNPSADGLNCDVAVPASDTNASFDLQFSATSADATQGTNGVVSATHTITVTGGTPPPAPLTAVDFVQTAG